MDVDATLRYLAFVEERHRVWELRQQGAPQPWTNDPVLASVKFTNVFRILDPGTQFIMTDLVQGDPGDRDMLMRVFLYRHTGRIDAWQYARIQQGQYPIVELLTTEQGTRRAWHQYRDSGTGKIFTNAYLVFPQSHTRGTDKLDSIVDLAKRLFAPDSDEDVVPEFLDAGTQVERFEVLRRNKGVGDFMAMQVLTDWGYLGSTDLEDEFVVPGPGAKRGLAALGLPSSEEAVRFVQGMIHLSPGCPTLQGRKPSLMDVQNTLCEFGKYERALTRPVGRAYSPAHPGSQPDPVLPEYW